MFQRLTDTIASAQGNKKYCTGLFLDVAQAFDKVWHNGLLFILKQFMPAPLYLILKAYLEDGTFKVRHGNAFSPLYNIEAGVPQGQSDLSPDLCNIFTMDIPKTNETLLATLFADDTAILSINNDLTTAVHHLQEHLNLIDIWSNNWMICINDRKSSRVTFTLRPGIRPAIKLKNKNIPVSNEIKYLGIILDERLTWKPHLQRERIIVNSRLRLFRHLLKSKLNPKTKTVLYNTMIDLVIWHSGAGQTSSLFRLLPYALQLVLRGSRQTFLSIMS